MNLRSQLKKAALITTAVALTFTLQLPAAPSPTPRPRGGGATLTREREGSPGHEITHTATHHVTHHQSDAAKSPSPKPLGLHRNDGQVQQQSTGKGPAHAGAAMKTGSPSPAAMDSVGSRIFYRMPVHNPTPSPRNLTTRNAKPSSHAGQGQGKPADGKKKGEKVSSTPSPR